MLVYIGTPHAKQSQLSVCPVKLPSHLQPPCTDTLMSAVLDTNYSFLWFSKILFFMKTIKSLFKYINNLSFATQAVLRSAPIAIFENLHTFFPLQFTHPLKTLCTAF